MSKKGENIRKRKDGRWEARYQKGRKPDGSIQYGYVYASKYTLVKEKRNLLASQPAQVSIPFSRIFQEWLKQIRCSVKDSSYCYYDTIIFTHLTPYFQKLSLQEFIFSLGMRHLSVSYILGVEYPDPAPAFSAHLFFFWASSLYVHRSSHRRTQRPEMERYPVEQW